MISKYYLDIMHNYILKCMGNRAKEIDLDYFETITWDDSCSKEEFLGYLKEILEDIFENYLTSDNIDKEIVTEVKNQLKEHHMTSKKEAMSGKNSFLSSLEVKLNSKFIYSVSSEDGSVKLNFKCSEMYNLRDIIELSWIEYKNDLKNDGIYKDAINGIIKKLACNKACSEIYSFVYDIQSILGDSDIISDSDIDLYDEIDTLSNKLIKYFYTDEIQEKVLKIAKQYLEKTSDFRNLPEYYSSLNRLVKPYIDNGMEISIVESGIYTHSKYVDIVSAHVEEERNKLFEQNQSQDEKNKHIINQKVSKELNKNISNSFEQASAGILIKILGNQDLRITINLILNYLIKLNDKNINEDEKNKIVYTLAGNSDVLTVFMSKAFVQSYFMHLYLLKDKDSGSFLKELEATSLSHLAQLLKRLSIDEATKLILRNMSSCSKATQEKIPSTIGEIKIALDNVLKFSTDKIDLNFKRKKGQELIFSDEFVDERNAEEKAKDDAQIQSMLDAANKAREESGGTEAYLELVRKKQNQYKLLNLTKLEGAEDDIIPRKKNEADFQEVLRDIRPTVNTIMDYYSSAFELIIKMRKFVGTYIFKESEDDRSYGLLEIDKSLKDSNAIALKTVNVKSSTLLKWLNKDYEYPIKDSLKVARHNQVPNLNNIVVEGYNYYPVFITRYALGFVKGVKYTKFDKFMEKVREDVEDRLYTIYKDKVVVNGKEFYGEDLFDAENTELNTRLIGAFVNAVIFLTGNSAESYDNAQIRSICAYPHMHSANYYTDYSTDGVTSKGLSDAAQVGFLEVNNSNKSNILEILYLKDKASFYNAPAWAFRELGNVYGTGDVPSIAKGESVVIGRQLSGELVEFDLGSNAAFVTSIFAGSRSGKGVTTLSILAAIMASKIGICYLDCKPDMANCFWDMENNAASHGLLGKTYAYDIKADSNRLGEYSPMKSLNKHITSSRSRLSESDIAASIFVLKNLQLMLLTGLYKQKHGDSSYMVWVLDEINNMLNLTGSGYDKLLSASKDPCETITDKKGVVKQEKKIEPEDKAYATAVVKFWKAVQQTLASGVNDIFGQCGYKFVVIGQNPEAMFKGGMPTGDVTSGKDLLRIIGNAATNKYIYGRGLKNVTLYGSYAFHKDKARTSDEKLALEDYKYFVMRGVPGKNANSPTDDEILFQPFLTLNFDDVLKGCWTGGIGRGMGYDARIKKGDPGYPEMIQNYKIEINKELGSGTLSNDILTATDVGKGVIDEGTGFYGLVKMYCSKDSNPDEAVLNTALKPYRDLDSILREMKFIGDGSFYGYQSIEDFLYDFSVEGMEITNYADYLKKLEDFESLSANGENDEDTGDIDISLDEPSENDITPNNSNLQEDENLNDINYDEQKELEQQARLLAEAEQEEQRNQDELLQKQEEVSLRLAEIQNKENDAKNREIALEMLNQYSVYADRVNKDLLSVQTHILSRKIEMVDIDKLVACIDKINKSKEMLNQHILSMSNNSFIRNNVEYTFDSLRNQTDLNLLNKTYAKLETLRDECQVYIDKIKDIESKYYDLQNGGDADAIHEAYRNEICNFNELDLEDNEEVYDALQNQKSQNESLKDERVSLENETRQIQNDITQSKESVNILQEQQRQAQIQAQYNQNSVLDSQINQARNQALQGQSFTPNQVQADPQVSMTRGLEENTAKTDVNGNTTTKDVRYVENVIRDTIPELEENLMRTSRFKFMDTAMVKRNQRDRYKLFVKTVEDHIGWVSVRKLEMTSSEIIITVNKDECVKVSVETLGANNYNIYEVMDFTDLLFNKVVRLHTLVLDEEVSEILISETGGEIYETLFNSIQTLQVIKIGQVVVDRHHRKATMQMALEAEVERASMKSKAKDAMTESFFGSGKVKNTSENRAKAQGILRRAQKSGRKTQTNKGLLTAKKIGQMTLPQAVGSAVAGVFLGIGGAIRRLSGK